MLYSLPCFCRVICQAILLNWECNTPLFKILEPYFTKANIQRLLGEWEGNCFNCIKTTVMFISASFLILAFPEPYANQGKLINPVNKHNNSFSCGIKEAELCCTLSNSLMFSAFSCAELIALLGMIFSWLNFIRIWSCSIAQQRQKGPLA